MPQCKTYWLRYKQRQGCSHGSATFLHGKMVKLHTSLPDLIWRDPGWQSKERVVLEETAQHGCGERIAGCIHNVQPQEQHLDVSEITRADDCKAGGRGVWGGGSEWWRVVCGSQCVN